MNKFKLAIGVHNHQPVGNFEAVFEDAHLKAYAPFLKLLESFDFIRLSLHQSGILWDWQEKKHPEYLDRIRKLVERGQVDLMTGGFYEPILISVPGRDALGQIDMLNRFLEDRFQARPKGLWLTERIWEPHLPSLLNEAGIEYLPIDDTHFIYAGLEEHELHGPLITENEGNRLILLPIQKKLRYLIPFGSVEEVIRELKERAEDNPDGLAVYADDGEKFGIWPDTYRHCFENGWLYNFFEALEQNSDWLEVITLDEAARLAPVGRAYLPSASYPEMLHWALPVYPYREFEAFVNWLKKNDKEKRFGRFVRGGHWRGFLTKYEEANLMHKKMLYISERLRAFEEENPERKNDIREIREQLYSAQCNCPYWHGIFGGLYLAHIRQAVYSGLVKADVGLRELMGEQGNVFEIADFDFDGTENIVVRNDEFSTVFKPGKGGTMLELSLNKFGFCLTDTLMRRREGYHDKLHQTGKGDDQREPKSIHDMLRTKEGDLSQFMIEDWYLKKAFIDHFFSDVVSFDIFRTGNYGEDGDFILEPYAFDIDREAGRVVLRRDGHLWLNSGTVPIRVVKKFDFNRGDGTIGITYEISSSYEEPVRINFGIENNFNFQAGHAEDRFILVDNKRPAESYLDSYGQHDDANTIALADQYRGIAVAVSSEQPAAVWHLPIFTVSISESGFEKVYQGTTIVHNYQRVLEGQPLVFNLTLHAGEINRTLEKAFSLATVGSR